MARKYTDRMFVHLLSQTGHAVSAEFVRVLRERGFTVRQWRVLGLLWDEESLTLTELAEGAFCGHSTITRLIERMVELGLIIRRSDEIDRRKTHVSLSPEGRNQIHDLVEQSERMEREVIASLGATRVERVMNDLRQMLTQLGEARQASRRPPG